MPIQVSNVKAADPGVGFTIEVTSPDTSINNTLRAVVTLRNPAILTPTFISEVWVKNTITKGTTLKMMAPFGDNAYAPGMVMQFTIELFMPFDATQPSVTEHGEVMTTAGRFNLGSNMIVKVEDFTRMGAKPSTAGMPMMVSEDGKYIGILYPDGNFKIFPQYVLGANKEIEPVYRSGTNDGQRINTHPVSISLVDGLVYFSANDHRLFVSEHQLRDTTAYLVIRKEGFFLIKPSTVYEPGEEAGPLVFKKI